jgi:RNA polymerase sigma-70 factor, ECF subfamily
VTRRLERGSSPLGNEGDDAAVIARVLAGDVGAYRILVTRYGGQAMRYASRLLGDRRDAEEAVQDTFVRAYRALERCADRERFGPWLFSILLNRCRTAGVRSGRLNRTFVFDDALVDAASAGEWIDTAAWRDEITRALAQLAAPQREAFLLKHVEQLSYEEMAEMTGVGISALKMRVTRAVARLRALLQEVYSG